jgi:5'(3')-deoxyribonucleotidase
MTTKLCGIDFDETLFRVMDAWAESYNQLTGKVFPGSVEYDFSDVFDPYSAAEFFRCRVPELYDSPLVQPRADTLWLVEWLLDHDWEIAVITHDTKPFISRKANLICEYYPRLKNSLLMMAKDKWSALPGMTMLIDDSPHSNATVHPAMPYNVGCRNRVEDLTEVPRLLNLPGWLTDEYMKTLAWSAPAGHWSSFSPDQIDRAWKRSVPRNLPKLVLPKGMYEA